MCVTALANLTQASAKEGTNTKEFSKDKDIIPFFEMHWEALTTTTRRVTQSWHSTVRIKFKACFYQQSILECIFQFLKRSFRCTCR